MLLSKLQFKELSQSHFSERIAMSMLQHLGGCCCIQERKMEEKVSCPIARASFDIDLCYYSS